MMKVEAASASILAMMALMEGSQLMRMPRIALGIVEYLEKGEGRGEGGRVWERGSEWEEERREKGVV